MAEMFKIAFTGANLVPTILMTFVLVYWLIMLIGLVNLDSIDVDVDTGADVHVDADVDINVDAAADADISGDVSTDIDADADADIGAAGGGFFNSLLLFVNAAHVPFMIIISFFVFFLWLITMLINSLPITKGGFLVAILLLPIALASILLTKGVTAPLVKLFKDVNVDYDSGAEILGRPCTLLCNLEPDRLGQAEIYDSGKHLVINVKTKKISGMNKGENALVLEKDKEKNFFYVVDFNQ